MKRRRWRWIAGGLLAALLGVAAAAELTLRVPAYDGPASDHFDGGAFRNPTGAHLKGFFGLAGDWVRFQLQSKPGAWRDWVDAPPGADPPRRVGPGELRVTFINHATLLIQLDGLNVLTDPIWSARCSPVPWVGPRRARPPGLRLEQLPPIDVVLISHDHYDHLDLPTLSRIVEAHHPRIFAGLGTRAFLESKGISGVTDLDWWQSAAIGPDGRVKLTGVPAQHFSNRALLDRDHALWLGFVLEAKGGPVYFAGDSGEGDHFDEIARRFGPLRLAVLPIGVYKPEWFMSPVHLSPAGAAGVHRRLNAAASVAIHFGTFPGGDEAEDEPPRELARALAQSPGAAPFWVLGFGEGRDVPPL